MERVREAARSIGAKWWQAWKIEPWDKALALARDEAWLLRKVREGYEIIDIGIDVTRAIRSDFYALEREILSRVGYPVTPFKWP
jgi:hypothetical protein